MNEITRLLERLSASLDSHVDPEIACIDIGSQLDALRQIYKIRPSAFTPEVIESLKRVARLNQDVRTLTFLVEDAKDPQCREYAHETANALACIAQCFEGMTLGDLAKARVRELRALIPTLPSEQKPPAQEVERAFVAAESWKAVSALAPECPKCGVTMVLRNGRYGDFWGCHGYPECTGTENLSPSARNKLIPARAQVDVRDDISSPLF